MKDPLQRFRNLETPPEARKDEFEERRKAELQSGVEIEASPGEEQPFLRCPFCEADNARFAVKCFNCSHALETDEVRSWNAAFWAERSAQLAEERAHAKADEQRLLADAITASALKEEARVAEEQRVAGLHQSTGTRLLQRIEDPSLRTGVSLGLVGLLVWAIYSLVNPFVSTGQHLAGLAVVVTLGALFGTLRHFRK